MHKLFSYGTLQQTDVQLATFGRAITGFSDELVGFCMSSVTIDDADVVATSGKSEHPIVKYTGIDDDHVVGTVFEVTHDELMRSDQYEVAAYKRVSAALASNGQAWVYIDARSV